MNSTLAIAVPIAVALVAALGGWLVKARQLSGKIETSEAADLWAESAAMREDYRERIKHAEERAERLEQRVDNCEDVNRLLREHISELQKELMEAQSR